MVMSKAKTAAAYLAELPTERRTEIAAVRDALRSRLAKGFDEGMGYGMITYCIPLSRYPSTYNKQPLMFVALAAQKTFNALYLTTYGDEATKAKVQDAFRVAGKTLDMDKSCIRFGHASELPLDAISRIVGDVSAEHLIGMYEASRATTIKKVTKSAVKKVAKSATKKVAKPAVKKVAKKR